MVGVWLVRRVVYMRCCSRVLGGIGVVIGMRKGSDMEDLSWRGADEESAMSLGEPSVRARAAQNFDFSTLNCARECRKARVRREVAKGGQ